MPFLRKALEPVPGGSGPSFFSRMFVVPKKSGGVRPIIDLKILNQYMKPNQFKMELAESELPFFWECGRTALI